MNQSNAEHFVSAYRARPHQKFMEWLGPKQERAIHQLEEHGLPTRRREDWRYTDVAPICRSPWQPPPEKTHDVDALRSKVEPLRFAGSGYTELFFINGQYSRALSRAAQSVQTECLIAPLRQAQQTHARVLQKHLGSCLDQRYDFASLNTAFITEGALVRIPDNVQLEQPIHLIFLTTEQVAAPFAFHPRNLFLLGKNSSATIIESYIGLDNESRYFNNTVSEAVLNEGAKLQYYRIQQESQQAHHIGHLCSNHGRDSSLSSFCIDLGAALARTDLYANLRVPGAEVKMHGLYMATGKQHTDQHIYVDHRAPHTRSDIHYRGILNDRGHGVFNGKVIVRQGAQKVDAHQLNANLLLSDRAEIDTKPELEIHADDVKCGHGATVGQIDENMLFYLRSRALDEETARTLLSFSFAHMIIDCIALEPLRQRLSQMILGYLPNAGMIRQFTQSPA